MPIAVGLYYYAYQSQDKDKLPVVFLHGAGGSHLYWPATIRRLKDFRTYAPDLPGHGRSGGRGYQSISTYVHSIRDWMEAINYSMIQLTALK